MIDRATEKPWYVKWLSCNSHTYPCWTCKSLIDINLLPVAEGRQQWLSATSVDDVCHIFAMCSSLFVTESSIAALSTEPFAKNIRWKLVRNDRSSWLNPGSRLQTPAKAQLNFAHCRTFETLHYWFSFIKLMSLRGLFVIALTVCKACHVHYYRLAVTVERCASEIRTGVRRQDFHSSSQRWRLWTYWRKENQMDLNALECILQLFL